MRIVGWAAALLAGLVVMVASGTAQAGWYQDTKNQYRINFPDGWSVAEDPANNAVRARKPDGSIDLAVQAVDLQGQVGSADVLADLYTTRVFNQFRLLDKQPDQLGGIPVVTAAYSGQDGSRQVILGALYMIQDNQGFVFYSVMDAARAQVLANESDAVFKTFARVTAAPAAPGGGVLSRAFSAMNPGNGRCQKVIGNWKWFTGSTHDFRADGSINGNTKNRWTCTEAERPVVKIVWNDGQWVDTLEFDRNGRALEGKNQRGDRVWGWR